MAGSFGRPLSVLLQNGRRLLVKGPTIRGFCCTGRLTNGTNGTVTSRTFSSAQPLTQKETVTIHFVMPDGKRKAAKAKLGDSLLDVVLENNLDIDGYGACEGTLACSTCHIVFKEEHFKKISIKPTDEELDMLDLAYGLSDTSRLGCQIVVTKDMDGWEVTVPAGFADARS